MGEPVTTPGGRIRQRAVVRMREGLRRLRQRYPGVFIDPPSPADVDELLASGLLDEAWYVERYPEAAASGLPPAVHYLAVGSRLGADPNPVLSTNWYRATYPDVARSGGEPVLHYLRHGAAEGRNPGPGFDTAYYLAQHPDLRVAGVNPLSHFLVAGRAEGRVAVPPRSRTGPSVVYVSGEPATPGHRYRVERMAAAARANGAHTRVLTVPEAASTGLAAFDSADLVVVWRAVWGPELDRALHRARAGGAAVLFDIDDLMFDPELATEAVIDGIRSQGLAEADVGDWYARIRRTLDFVDGCVCTTEPLARQVRRLGVPAWVVPNGVDDDTVTRSWLAVRRRRDHDVVRLGYASGSRTHQRDLAVAAPAIVEVLTRHPEARLVVYRDATDLSELSGFDPLGDQVEWRDLVPLEDLPDELARLDVNLAPLEVGNPFCEAKSALKWFEAALVRVPTVASPTEPFREAVRDGVDGLLAATTQEWVDHLEALVADPALRRRLGEAARLRVTDRLGERRRAQQVAAVHDQVLDRGARAAAAFALAAHQDQLPPPQAPLVTDHEVLRERDRWRTSQVTVVMPVYNYGRYVAEALASVAAQTLGDLDLVVVDDASTDDSVQVVADWLDAHQDRFNRVLHVRHRRNGGVTRARNAAFALAATPYVLPVDADNVLLPGCCEELLTAVRASSADFAYPWIETFGEESDLFDSDGARGYHRFQAQRLVPGNYIDAMALVRVDAWIAAGGYREGVTGWEDYDLWCRLLELGRFGVQVPQVLARYRVHHESMLHTRTHVGDRLAQVQGTMASSHPWLRLDDHSRVEPAYRPVVAVDRPVPGGFVLPAGDPVPAAAAAAAEPPRDRAARLTEILPLLRSPQSGRRLVLEGDRLRDGDATWRVRDGRPVLLPPDQEPQELPGSHRGNPLPARAAGLVAELDGWGLHLSGGGTSARDERMIELDAAIFGPTDVVGDVHRLPFPDASLGLVVAMNAFEHYRNPVRAAAEIRRVLRPGGMVMIHTAFLQPVHEAPHHYYNATRYGVARWFQHFATVDLTVSDNFHPGYTLAWMCADAETVLGEHADALSGTTAGELAALWSRPELRGDSPAWRALSALEGPGRDRLAAGFEYVGRVPGR